MQFILKPEMFVNRKFTISYGNREALFTIVDEDFFGKNSLGRLNVITIFVRKTDGSGKTFDAQYCTTIIGLGDGVVGIHSEDVSLRGKQLNKDNMERCVVELYEDE